MSKRTDRNEQDLDAAYKAMAQDKKREAEALEWAEATIGDVSDEDMDQEGPFLLNLRSSAPSAPKLQ